MNKISLLTIFFIVFIPLAALLAYKWWKIFNSPDGERYLKRRMQGPFVPLRQEEIAEDLNRSRKNPDR